MEGAAPRPHRSLQPSCLLLLDSLSAEDDERLALERFFLRPSVEGSGHSGAPLVGLASLWLSKLPSQMVVYAELV